MKSKRPFGTARRLAATSVAVLTVGIGLGAGVPAAHASGCGWTGGWVPMTLVNGWASEQNVYDTGDPSYCLETDGMVYLSGSIAASSGTPASEMFATLPPAERPAHEIYLDVYTLNGTYGILRIDPSGTMEAYGSSANGFTSLAGVSFPAAGVSQTGITQMENGWESAQSVYNTGDPAYTISNGIVHLSGSLYRPAGAGTGDNWKAAAIVPPAALPSDNCFWPDTYTYGGSISYAEIDNDSGTLWGSNTQYMSLAGFSYPTAPTAWQPLTLLNGSEPDSCNTGPSYFISGDVVYLTGMDYIPTNFNSEIAVLPPAARPTHYIYMIASGIHYGAGSTAADCHVTLRIGPDGAIWVFRPSGSVVDRVSLSGLSFHALS